MEISESAAVRIQKHIKGFILRKRLYANPKYYKLLNWNKLKDSALKEDRFDIINTDEFIKFKDP